MKERKGRLVRLESIRGFAAAAVVLNHARLLEGTWFSFVGHLGQEAVILFFLLSGFVIHFSTFGKCGPDRDQGKSPPFKRYFLHRFRRIYPLFIISLAASYLAFSLSATHWLAFPWSNLAGHLVMLQDVMGLKRGVWFDVFCGNFALWSLSYEWWFYMLFFPTFMAMWDFPRVQRYAVAGLSSAAFVVYQIYPNEACLILGYFYIWWTGVELSREFSETGRLSWSGQRSSVILLALLTTLWALPVVMARLHHHPLQLGADPVLQFRHFAMATVFLLVGILWYLWKLRGFDALLKWFAALAPITYALYILHVPGLMAADALMPTVPRLLRVVILLIVLLPLCYLLEVRLQRRLNRWFDLLDPSRSKRTPVAVEAIATP